MRIQLVSCSVPFSLIRQFEKNISGSDTGPKGQTNTQKTYSDLFFWILKVVAGDSLAFAIQVGPLTVKGMKSWGFPESNLTCLVPFSQDHHLIANSCAAATIEMQVGCELDRRLDPCS